MKLLFKREQSARGTAKAKFKLWGKIELDEHEAEVVKRYKFDNAVLIVVDQPNLLRNSALIGVVVSLVVYGMFATGGGTASAVLLALFLGPGVGYYFYHQNRETIFVRDLIHGRHFTCDSVIELARKEHWLQTIVGFLRQVMESAKHWDGTETHDVPALEKAEAKLLIIEGLRFI